MHVDTQLRCLTSPTAQLPVGAGSWIFVTQNGFGRMVTIQGSQPRGRYGFGGETWLEMATVKKVANSRQVAVGEQAKPKRRI